MGLFRRKEIYLPFSERVLRGMTAAVCGTTRIHAVPPDVLNRSALSAAALQIGLGQFRALSAIAIIATLLYSMACACAPSGRGLGMSV